MIVEDKTNDSRLSRRSDQHVTVYTIQPGHTEDDWFCVDKGLRVPSDGNRGWLFPVPRRDNAAAIQDMRASLIAHKVSPELLEAFSAAVSGDAALLLLVME